MYRHGNEGSHLARGVNISPRKTWCLIWFQFLLELTSPLRVLA
ncbi:hypothetical protein D030_1338A, partial [Vibrio parahaemolyticus AQ3810]